MKHTKGPWKIKAIDNIVHITEEGTNHGIAQVYGQFSGGQYNAEEVAANANLISAAPDLYKSVQALLTSVGTKNEMLARVNAVKALHKAEGAK